MQDCSCHEPSAACQTAKSTGWIGPQPGHDVLLKRFFIQKIQQIITQLNSDYVDKRLYNNSHGWPRHAGTGPWR